MATTVIEPLLPLLVAVTCTACPIEEELKLALMTREDRWPESRDRWANEKLEAETVIRNLLRRLSEKEVEFEELGSPSPAD